MSNFPFAWWDKTITIYNKDVDPVTQHTTWYRTVVKNCFWKAENITFSMGRYGVSTIGVVTDNKNIICRIPKDKRFLDKRKWKETENKSGKFTLANGDIIILGNVDDVIDDYVAGSRSTDIIAKYKEFDACLEVDTYIDNVQTGVSLEHYRVVGK